MKHLENVATAGQLRKENHRQEKLKETIEIVPSNCKDSDLNRAVLVLNLGSVMPENTLREETG